MMPSSRDNRTEGRGKGNLPAENFVMYFLGGGGLSLRTALSMWGVAEDNVPRVPYLFGLNLHHFHIYKPSNQILS